MAKLRNNNLLLGALEKQVLAGNLVPSAVHDLYDAWENECEVSPTENQVFMDNTPLDKAVEDRVKARPFLAPAKSAGPTDADKLAELQASALAGNVTSHGQLAKQMGADAYEAWRIKNKAAPGKDASNNSTADALAEMERTIQALKAGKPVPHPRINGVDPNARNPWSKEFWNVTLQGQTVKALGVEKAAAIAAAAGSRIGATKAAA